VTIFRSRWSQIAAHGPYDLILANAVLCQHPESIHVDRLNELFPFSVFKGYLRRLVDCLAPGGLLMLADCTYPPAFTPSAAALVPIDLLVGGENEFLPFAGLVERFLPSGWKFAARAGAPEIEGFAVVRPHGLSPAEAFFDLMYLKRTEGDATERYEVVATLDPAVTGLDLLGRSTSDCWAPDVAGTPFVGQSLQRELRRIDDSRRLLVERRRVVDLSSGETLRSVLTAMATPTERALEPDADAGRSRFLNESCYRIEGGARTRLDRSAADAGPQSHNK
jgi:hypothetical protein